MFAKSAGPVHLRARAAKKKRRPRASGTGATGARAPYGDGVKPMRRILREFEIVRIVTFPAVFV